MNYKLAVTEALTPEEVKEMLAKTFFNGSARLCRDYLTLWERIKELEAEVKDWMSLVDAWEDAPRIEPRRQTHGRS